MSVSKLLGVCCLREAAKKNNGLFLVAQPLMPYPPPLELSGHTIFFKRFSFNASKTVFFLINNRDCFTADSFLADCQNQNFTVNG